MVPMMLTTRPCFVPGSFSTAVSADASRMHRSTNVCCAVLRLTDSKGAVTSIEEATASVGSAEGSTVRISGPNVEPRHAELGNARGKVTCTALVGDAEDFTSESHTWLDDTPLRTGVQYLLSPGCSLAFGTPDQTFAVNFEAPSGDNPMLEMMLKGMAAGASQEVQKELGL